MAVQSACVCRLLGPRKLSFLKKRSCDRLHTRYCTPLDPQQHARQVWNRSDEQFSRYAKDIHTYRHTDRGSLLYSWIDYCIHSKLKNLLYIKKHTFIVSWTCIACQVNSAPLHQSQMYITLFITPVLLSLLWIFILSQSTQLSLKKRTAALTHYKSFRTFNLKKKQKPFLLFWKCPYLSKHAGFSWPVSFAFCSAASCTGTKCFFGGKGRDTTGNEWQQWRRIKEKEDINLQEQCCTHKDDDISRNRHLKLLEACLCKPTAKYNYPKNS